MGWRICVATVASGLVVATTAVAQQQVTVTAPMQRLNSSFSEQSGFGWSVGGPHWSFRFGGGSGGFSQSSDRSFVGSAPSLTVTPGVPGHFFSGQVSPFVTGVRPLVADSPAAIAAQQQRQQQLSSVIEANVKLDNEKLRQHLRRAERAEQAGDFKTARANYRRAVSVASPPVRWQIQQRMQAMFANPQAANQQAAR